MFDFDPQKNYYEILWLDENASEEDIKKTYKKLALKYHPDRNKWEKESEEKFKQINEAYQVLWDKNKKNQYDSYRKWWYSNFDFWSNFWWWASWFDVENIFDVFWDIFWQSRWSSGRKSSRNRVHRWEDISLNLEISVEEAFKWAKKEITYKRISVCEDCNWTWTKNKSSKSVCNVCKWTWTQIQTQQTPFWVMQVQTTCRNCWWEWYVNTNPCETCNWNWVVYTKSSIVVQIPNSINWWEYIKYPWMWNWWVNWWEYWDLYVKIVLKEWKYKKNWINLISDIQIDIFTAVLWWEIEVDHPDWKIVVKVPKWIQFWDNIKIPWKWFWEKWFFSKKWDYILKTSIDIPTKINKDQEKLWRNLKNLTDK